MKKIIIYLLPVIIFAGIGIYFISNRPQNSTTTSQPSPTAQTSIEQVEAMPTGGSRYIVYSPDRFENEKDKKRVYFFHAAWCPTCKAANTEFEENLGKIPEDVLLFKTDYDTNAELKTQFGITYQHTFVLVDEQGKEIKKWNGGGIDELIENTQ